MSDHTRDAAFVGGKIAVGLGPTSYGLVTLDSVALVLGILCSLAVLGHTLWKWWWDVRDRRTRAVPPPGRTAQDE